MKITLVSDLHIDVNQNPEYGFENKETDLLLIAGDTAGSAIKEIEFLQRLKCRTICIGGNHLGYDYLWDRQKYQLLGLNEDPRNGTKEDSIKTLTTYNFDNVTYLENQSIDIGDYIVYGGTCYSDFMLFGDKHKEDCMWTAQRWLNDFRYVYTYKKKEKEIRPVTPEDYIQWNKQFMKGLTKCIKESDKPIIVLSHFAPSVKSISGKYLYQKDRLSSPGTGLNAVYANNLEDFILNNPKIKYFLHGHVHDQHDYMIGDCRVISYPYGYFGREQTLEPKDYMGFDFTI